MTERRLDLVAYGATGFTGRFVVEYLRDHAPAGLSWAVAGRSAERLRERCDTLGVDVPILVADSEDPASVDAVARRTRVLLTTAGPFGRYGDPVVAACVAHGTHYVDITGEPAWVRSVIDRFHDRAAADGTRIVPCCGFDSVPSDLGTYMMARWVRETWGQDTRRVTAGFSLRSGLNGGTAASAVQMSGPGYDPIVGDPLCLNPPARRTEEIRARNPNFRGHRWDDDLGGWLAPFVMEIINARVVRRSDALLALRGEGYGPAFSYTEATLTKRRSRALTLDLGTRLAERLMPLGATRRLLQAVVPPPGTGPSDAARAQNFYRCRLIAVAEDGRKAMGEVSERADPGNESTVKMLCESALCLAVDGERLPGGAGYGGVLTPATAFGDVLLQRLRAAGMTWEVGPLT